MLDVQEPVIPIVGELIRENPGTLSLGQGVVYYGPPAQIAERLAECLADPANHRYRPVQGVPALLEALQDKLRRENGIQDPDVRLVVTAGGNMAFMNAVLAVSDPGDEFILQSPYYFNHEMAVVMAGCRPVVAPTDAHYQLDPDAVRRAIGPRTRAVVTISPNNPTGAVYPEETLRAVNALCAEHGIYHIHDEAYEYFTYDGLEHFSPGSIPGSSRHTISLFSLSKSYGFAGWRIGCMTLPERLYVPVKKIQDTILICPPVISQFAALGCLDAGASYCRDRQGPIVRVRQQMLQALADAADLCEAPAAQGAFYLLLKIPTQKSAMEVTERLVREFGVAVIPGSAFGVAEPCLLRVAYGALDEATAAEGLRRLIEGLRAVTRDG